ncbi:mini-chromosome maintenance complex-binding protein isoform X2 [Periplaneta americana]
MQQLNDPSNWSRIPSLNDVTLKDVADQQLVHFLGMIQDMHNPELFLERYEVQHCVSSLTAVRLGKYWDIPRCGPDEVLVDDSVHNVNKERQSLCCISVPALNSWAKQPYGTNLNRSTACISKQPDRNEKGHPDESPSVNDAEPSPKRLCTDNRKSAANDLESNLPLPGPEAKTCLVKVYNNDEKLSLNDVIEVIGFLSKDPVMENVSNFEEMDEDGDVCNHVQQVPLPPRLHALCMRKRKHCNPLVDHAFCNTGEMLGLARTVRDDLHLVLSQMLLGDHLAADYLICHLISTVFQRSELLALGQFSLNLSGMLTTDGYSRHLYAVLEQLLTKSHFLPLTLDNLNKGTFIPRKDYEQNRLLSGLLQLSAQTHLVLDETCLQQGQLDSNGVHNIAALGALISQQKVDYDFKYYTLEFHTDVPVLVLSEGKSLLPSNVNVPLEFDAHSLQTKKEIFEAVGHFLQEPMLHKLRKYLTVMSHLQYSLPQDLEKVIQDDFVRLRRGTGSTTSASDLHLLLVLARLVSLSRGEQSLSKESWELACSMEKQRKHRVSQYIRH